MPLKPAIRVAIVDDDIAVRQCVCRLLQLTPEYHCVGSYAGGYEALTDIRVSRPQAALIDLLLPDMDGAECVRRLRQQAPDCKFILFTGFRDPSSLHKTRQMGAHGYLVKPITIEALVSALGAVFTSQFAYFDGTLELLPPMEAITDANPVFLPELVKKTLFDSPPSEAVTESCLAIARAACFRVAKLAAMCQFSPGQLARQMHLARHKSPRDWLHDCQMEEAGALLLKQFSIKECARQLGYRFESNFCNEFSRHFHRTPSQYILAHQTKAEAQTPSICCPQPSA